MIKTTNIIPALIRKVNPPIKLYKSPPNISPTIMAMLTCLHFLGNTDGTFGTANDFTVVGPLFSVAAGDFKNN